jgi:hypothetical protein
MTTTFLKRQKERKRQEKQIAKAQNRAQKKLEAQTKKENPEEFSFDASFDPSDLNAVNFDPKASHNIPGESDVHVLNPTNASAAVPSANTSYFASNPGSARTPLSVPRSSSGDDSGADSGSKPA